LRRQTTAQKRPAGGEGLTDVAQCLDRTGEEHDPHSREGVVEALLEGGRLHVPDGEAEVADAGLRRLLAGDLDEGLGDVDPDSLTRGANQPGEPLRGVAKAATDVQDLASGRRRILGESRLAMGSEPVGDQRAEADEALEERPAPGVGRLLVVRGHWLHVRR
jgi:hypothetical protein